MMERENITTHVIALEELPPLSFAQNWLILCSALTLLDIPLSTITKAAQHLNVPEHRLEKVRTYNDVDFYNDSKSSTPQATLAAVERLQGRPIHLFLGGLSKGVDRKELVASLTDKVAYLYCFGKEAQTLHTW